MLSFLARLNLEIWSQVDTGVSQVAPHAKVILDIQVESIKWLYNSVTVCPIYLLQFLYESS